MFDNISSQMQASGLLREADRDHRKLQFDTKFLENKSTTIKFFTKGSPVRFIISGHPLKEPFRHNFNTKQFSEDSQFISYNVFGERHLGRIIEVHTDHVVVESFDEVNGLKHVVITEDDLYHVQVSRFAKDYFQNISPSSDYVFFR